MTTPPWGRGSPPFRPRSRIRPGVRRRQSRPGIRKEGGRAGQGHAREGDRDACPGPGMSPPLQRRERERARHSHGAGAPPNGWPVGDSLGVCDPLQGPCRCEKGRRTQDSVSDCPFSSPPSVGDGGGTGFKRTIGHTSGDLRAASKSSAMDLRLR